MARQQKEIAARCAEFMQQLDRDLTPVEHRWFRFAETALDNGTSSSKTVIEVADAPPKAA